MRIACKTQGTHEWHQARLGICRGSEAGKFSTKLTRKSKNGGPGDWGGGHWDVVRDLAWEHITGFPTDHYVSKPMEIGSQYEGEARVEFWMQHGLEVEQTGFVLHPTLNYLGCSVDGYVIENGLYIPVELKVPTIQTHKEYLEDGVCPEIYTCQVQTEMLCFDRAPYGYFASYCPPDVYSDFPDHMRLFKLKVMADETKWAEIEEAATATMEHVVAKVKQLQAMYPAKGAPRTKFNAELRTAVLATEIRSEAEEMAATESMLDRIEMTP